MRCLGTLLVVCLGLGLLPTTGSPGAPALRPHHGSPQISLEVQDAAVQDVLRLLAEMRGVNLLAGEDVQGTVTVRLRDVSWEQALEAVLQLTDLVQERQGNVILILSRTRAQQLRHEGGKAR